MIPIDYKITIFSKYLFVYFFENIIIILWLVYIIMYVTKQKMVSTLQWLIIGEPIIAHDAKKWITSALLNGYLLESP